MLDPQATHNNNNSVPPVDFTAEDLPSHSDKDSVFPTDSHSYISQQEKDTNLLLPMHKSTYEKLVHYIRFDRQSKVAECNTLKNRIHNVEASLPLVPSESAAVLTTVIQEQRSKVEALEEELRIKDEQVGPYKEEIKSNLFFWNTKDPIRIQEWITKHQWPDPLACQDLGSPPQFPQYWYQGSQPAASGYDNPMALVQLLRRIRELEQEKETWKKEAKVINGPRAYDVIRERRRRVRVPQFDHGTVDEAQKWIIAYESMCTNFLKFTDQEMVEELYVALNGRAGSWFNSLSGDIRKDWRLVKERFLHQFCGDTTKPAVSALNKLKILKQGNMPISDFINIFKDLIHRTGLLAPDVQLHLFKGGVRPELADALIFDQAKDLDTAIEIVTRAEREWKRRIHHDLSSDAEMTAAWSGTSIDIQKMHTSSTSGRFISESSGGPRRSQQQKETRECFYCHKLGHLKIDCRILKKKLSSLKLH